MRISDWSSDVCSSDLIKNSLLVFDSAFDTFMTIKVNTGSDNDWVVGDFFSVLQLGDGKVEIKTEAGGNLKPSPGFTVKTRGKHSIISATNFAPISNSWAVSGDLMNEAVTNLYESFVFTCTDETTAITAGVGKSKMRK